MFANEIEQVRLSTPVEEYQIGINIDEDREEYKLLKYYNEYITTTISIFGSFNIIQQANLGNSQLNISATQICYQIAQENGWNEHLDMSIEFNVEIDKLYNPNNLRERASKTYEIIRNRSQLLSDFELKLDSIFEIGYFTSIKSNLFCFIFCILSIKPKSLSSLSKYLFTECVHESILAT